MGTTISSRAQPLVELKVAELAELSEEEGLADAESCDLSMESSIERRHLRKRNVASSYSYQHGSATGKK